MFRCIHPRQRTVRRLGCILSAVALLLVAACESPRDRTVRLNAEEERLVREVIELVRARVERTRDPQRADSLLSNLPPLYDDQERESLLDRLSSDTPRGAAVVAAIHDSLEALRDRIFPTGGGAQVSNPSGVAPEGEGRRKTP
jgi:hypothetical protein